MLRHPIHYMNRKYLYISVAIVVLAGVAIFVGHHTKDPVKKVETQGYNVAEWTLAKKCSDGTDIYQLADGDYAVWRGQDENDQHWVKLAAGVTPDDYCD